MANTTNSTASLISRSGESVLDAQGAFTQDDWEFELDCLSDRSIEALDAHLKLAPSGNLTALALKGALMQDQAHFTAFD